MITTAGKLWFGAAAAAFGGLVVYLLATRGEWFGGLVLGSIVLGALLLGFLAGAIRDGDVPATAGDADVVPARRTLPAGWPALGAVGAGITIVGLAGGNALFFAGLGVLAVVVVEWMAQAWAERSSADHAYNHALRNRVMLPVEIPALAVLGVAVVAIPLSRVLLATPKTASVVIAIVIAALILGIATLISFRPRVSSSVLTTILAVGAVAVIASGIVSAVAGEREFEHHGTEHPEDPGSDESNNPSDDEGGSNQSEPGTDPAGPDAESDH